MGVDFGGSDALVPEQCLYDAQVGTSLEQCGGEGVAQGVGRDVFLDACFCSLSLNHDENHGACEVGTPPVEKHVVFFSRLDTHLVAHLKPQVQLVQSTVGDGHEALFLSLSHDAQELVFAVEVGQFQVGKFRYAQPT